MPQKLYFLPRPRSSRRSQTIEKIRNVTKPRRVCARRRKKTQSFSPAACTAEKIPLGSQTCALCAFWCTMRALQRAAISSTEDPEKRSSVERVPQTSVPTGAHGRAAAAGQPKNSVTSQNPAAEAAGFADLWLLCGILRRCAYRAPEHRSAWSGRDAAHNR